MSSSSDNNANSDAGVPVIFEGKKYDLAPYVKLHPGGSEALLRNSNKDITDLLHGQPAHKPVINFIRRKLKTLEA